MGLYNSQEWVFWEDEAGQETLASDRLSKTVCSKGISACASPQLQPSEEMSAKFSSITSMYNCL